MKRGKKRVLSKKLTVDYNYWQNLLKDNDLSFEEFEDIFEDMIKALDILTKSNKAIRKDYRKMSLDKQQIPMRKDNSLMVSVGGVVHLPQYLPFGHVRTILISLQTEFIRIMESPPKFLYGYYGLYSGYYHYNLYEKYYKKGNKNWPADIPEEDIDTVRQKLKEFRSAAIKIYGKAKKEKARVEREIKRNREILKNE